MHRSLTFPLLALTLGASIPALAEDTDAAPAAEASASAGTSNARRDVMIAAYGGWAGVQRFAAECGRRGFDKSKAIGQAVAQTGAKYGTELAEAKLLYEDEANADQRREVDTFVHREMDALLKKPGKALRQKCEQAAKEASSLTTNMGRTFAIAETLTDFGAPAAGVSDDAPPPVPDEAPAEDAAANP